MSTIKTYSDGILIEEGAVWHSEVVDLPFRIGTECTSVNPTSFVATVHIGSKAVHRTKPHADRWSADRDGRTWLESRLATLLTEG